MCGRYNVVATPGLFTLMHRLGLERIPEERRDVPPGAFGQFVVERDGARQLLEGVWSLLIEAKPNGSGFRPNPGFSTFNARSDNLRRSRLWRDRYLRQRAIVPVSAFHEWKDGRCYNVSQQAGAIALAGLYEIWQFGAEMVPAFTVITLPPHPKFTHIHSKSIPLMLEEADFDAWLDPTFTQVDAFTDLMVPKLRQPLLVTPIDSPKTLAPAGESETIPAD